MTKEKAAGLLTNMPTRAGGLVIRAMEPDAQAPLLKHLGPDVANRLLKAVGMKT